LVQVLTARALPSSAKDTHARRASAIDPMGGADGNGEAVQGGPGNEADSLIRIGVRGFARRHPSPLAPHNFSRRPRTPAS